MSFDRPGHAARVRLFVVVLLFCAAQTAFAQAPVSYRLTFREPEHRWMQVEATFREVPAGPLELRMSRSSPGRYAIHEFAKNVFDLRITDESGAPLAVSHPRAEEWTVTGHSGTVRATYRIFGDRVDGTYLGIDWTHAHVNMPAALMWARGFDLRPVTVRFEAPPGRDWRVGTQLMPGSDASTFTAPNLQYLMDSPAEFSAFSLRTFTIRDVPRSPTFRLVVHHTGTDEELDGFARDVERIVSEARHVFREYPAYEGNTYTFIADYLPWASGDGMEHRNSTIVTSATSIHDNRAELLDTIAHEFFHSWNVERIRPRSLEPFNFEDANMSGELWLGEGFTNYYGPLVLVRSGVTTIDEFASEMGETLDTMLVKPGRLLRSAEEMSQLAPFVDAATSIDRTNFDNTFISYYTFGEAIGLGLDLTLRDRSNGGTTLDHYMRALWEKHGKPGGRRPGYVDNPYTMADLEATLAVVSGDATFAREFFARYIRGRELVDYERLLGRAGLLLRRVAPGRGFAGDLRVQDVDDHPKITAPVPLESPAYDAGLERDDIIVSIGGAQVGTAADVDRTIEMHKAGDVVPIVFERRGQRVTGQLRLIENPHVELVPAEMAGTTLTAEQQQFRTAWLSSGAGGRR